MLDISHVQLSHLQGVDPGELQDFSLCDIGATALAVLKGDIDLDVPTPEENAIQELLNAKVNILLAHSMQGQQTSFSFCK